MARQPRSWPDDTWQWEERVGNILVDRISTAGYRVTDVTEKAEYFDPADWGRLRLEPVWLQRSMACLLAERDGVQISMKQCPKITASCKDEEKQEEQDQWLHDALERESRYVGFATYNYIRRECSQAPSLRNLEFVKKAICCERNNFRSDPTEDLCCKDMSLGARRARVAARRREVEPDAMRVQLDLFSACSERDALRSERDALRSERDALQGQLACMTGLNDKLLAKLAPA